MTKYTKTDVKRLPANAAFVAGGLLASAIVDATPRTPGEPVPFIVYKDGHNDQTVWASLCSHMGWPTDGGIFTIKHLQGYRRRVFGKVMGDPEKIRRRAAKALASETEEDQPTAMQNTSVVFIINSLHVLREQADRMEAKLDHFICMQPLIDHTVGLIQEMHGWWKQKDPAPAASATEPGEKS